VTSVSRPFLTADWHHVLGVTYATEVAPLVPYLPPGAEIDELGGAARVSLVAFGFRRTRVRGLAIAGHITFPEINLRFYVRLHGERAVVFIREFVPRPAISLVARLLYNEPYRTIPMRETVIEPGSGPTAHDGRTRSYRVEHPVWALHEVSDLKLDVDFAALYGREWGWLHDAQPSHVTLAAGSGVRISAPVDTQP